jgi:Bacterial regulatory protein, Fis family
MSQKQARDYADTDRAAALAALDGNQGNVERTAQQLNIPRRTLRGWIDGDAAARVDGERQAIKEDLSELLEDLACRLVGAALTKVKEGSATLLQIATALGITVDKMNVLRGRPSSITGRVMNDEERLSRVVEILNTVGARDPGQLAQAGESTVDTPDGPADPSVPVPG